MNASLNEKIQNVKWGKYKLEDLFESSNGNYDIQRKHINGVGDYVVTSGLTNNGIMGKSDVIAKVFKRGTITVDMFGLVFYRNFDYKMVTHARVFSLKPKISISDSQGLFIASAFSYIKNSFGFDNMCTWDKIKDLYIQLPTVNNHIDFQFIDSFVAELKVERIARLSAYLKASGLDNYELSDVDLQAIHEFESLTCNDWSEFKIGELFDRVKTIKLPYKADDLPKQPTGNYTLPCLTSSFQNQGLNYYAPIENATVLSNVISIPSNSDVYRAYYQPNDFTVLSDAYAIRWKKDDIIELSPEQYIFMVMCINKVTDLPIYSYKNKLGGWNIVKGKYIQLPVKNGVINFDLMGKYIIALKKLAIKEVAVYTEKEEQALLSVSD